MIKETKQILAVGLSLLIAVSSWGYQDTEGTSAGGAADGAPMSASELQALVAPIALYPDALVAQILAAATFPDEVAVADYWLQQNHQLTGTSLTQAVDKQSWDSSVKALTEFPAVLDNLAKNLTWTSSLGEAYHNQPSEVMAAIQSLRAKAKAAGNLKSTPQMTVVQQTPQTIVIEPADPQVVYVPEYNPAVVYGTPYVTPGYTAGDVAAAGVIGFGAGIALGALAGGGGGWGWNSWNCNWNGGAVVYNHNNFYGNTAWHGGYYNGGYHDGYGYHNDYNRAAVNNFRGSASRIKQLQPGGPEPGFKSHQLLEPRRKRLRKIERLQRAGRSFRRSRRLGIASQQLPRLGKHARRRLRRRPVRRRLRPLRRRRLPRGPALGGHCKRTLMSQLRSHLKIVIFALLILLASCGKTVKSPPENAGMEKTVPKTFATPSEAGAALLAAAQSGDRSAWLEIFGPDGKGNPVHGRCGAGWDQYAGFRGRVHANEPLGTNQGGRPDPVHRSR